MNHQPRLLNWYAANSCFAHDMSHFKTRNKKDSLSLSKHWNLKTVYIYCCRVIGHKILAVPNCPDHPWYVSSPKRFVNLPSHGTLTISWAHTKSWSPLLKRLRKVKKTHSNRMVKYSIWYGQRIHTLHANCVASPHQFIHLSSQRVEIYINFIRVTLQFSKDLPQPLTEFHSPPPPILSCPNQFVLEECGFL